MHFFKRKERCYIEKHKQYFIPDVYLWSNKRPRECLQKVVLLRVLCNWIAKLSKRKDDAACITKYWSYFLKRFITIWIIQVPQTFCSRSRRNTCLSNKSTKRLLTLILSFWHSLQNVISVALIGPLWCGLYWFCILLPKTLSFHNNLSMSIFQYQE